MEASGATVVVGSVILAETGGAVGSGIEVGCWVVDSGVGVVTGSVMLLLGWSGGGTRGAVLGCEKDEEEVWVGFGSGVGD